MGVYKSAIYLKKGEYRYKGVALNEWRVGISASLSGIFRGVGELTWLSTIDDILDYGQLKIFVGPCGSFGWGNR